MGEFIYARDSNGGGLFMFSLTDFKRESYFKAKVRYKFENCPKQKVQDCKWFHKSTSRCIFLPFHCEKLVFNSQIVNSTKLLK